MNLEELSERERFEIKLQISLYFTAKKVIVEERKEEFENYMEERKKKIREILNIEHGKIYEKNELILEV